ncbi:MAG: hypothetical protein D6712_14860, partial [Chloroflexi bacterium]
YLANVNANIQQRQQEKAAQLLGNIFKGIIDFVGGVVEGIGKLFNRDEKTKPATTLSHKHKAITASDKTVPTGGFGGFSKFGSIQFAGNLFDDVSGVYRPVQQDGDVGNKSSKLPWFILLTIGAAILLPMLLPGPETSFQPGEPVPDIPLSARIGIWLREGPECTNSERTRSVCALQVYDALNEAYGGNMTYDELLGAVLYSEGQEIYDYDAERDEVYKCFENMEKIDCNTFRRQFERAIVQNLRSFCSSHNYGDNIALTNRVGDSVPLAFRIQFAIDNTAEVSCSGADVIYWLAGVPGATNEEGRISGIQGIYQAGGPDGANLGDFNYNPDDPDDPFLFDVIGFDRIMGETMADTEGEECSYCIWGNQGNKPESGLYVHIPGNPRNLQYFIVRTPND